MAEVALEAAALQDVDDDVHGRVHHQQEVTMVIKERSGFYVNTKLANVGQDRWMLVVYPHL